MARIRTIKPEFWTSEQVVECSPIARLLFIGLLSITDECGEFDLSITSAKVMFFPGDCDIDRRTIARLFDELTFNKVILPIMFDSCDAMRYKIPNIDKYCTFTRSTVKSSHKDGSSSPSKGSQVIRVSFKNKDDDNG